LLLAQLLFPSMPYVGLDVAELPIAVYA